MVHLHHSDLFIMLVPSCLNAFCFQVCVPLSILCIVYYASALSNAEVHYESTSWWDVWVMLVV